jgi:hypothetical protein
VDPVFQTRVGAEDGDCIEACVATILGLPDTGGVPVNDKPNDEIVDYLLELDEWLEPRCLGIVAFDVQGRDGRYPVVIGETTRWMAFVDAGDPGHYHALVMCGHSVEHDPHPAQPFRGAVVDDLIAVIVLLVRR